MIVLVEEIGEAGRKVDAELSVDYLTEVLSGDGQATGFRPVAPSTLHAAFVKVSDKLLLDGQASVRVAGECKRCLTEITLEVPVQFKLDLVARRREAAEPSDLQSEHGKAHDEEGRAASFVLESVDQEQFDGKQIDLGHIFREQLLLALPMDALCKESCKGLCPVCGQDLNVAECGCKREVTDPRWAALKNIKLT